MSYKIIKPNSIDIEHIKTKIKNSISIQENIILDVSELFILENEILDIFNFFVKNNTNGISFVVINKEISLDNLPEEINIVPTFQEAIDLIDLEEMMRDIE